MVYYISAGQTSLLQVQWEFTLGSSSTHKKSHSFEPSIRLRRICSPDKTFKIRTNELTTYLMNRGYKRDFVRGSQWGCSKHGTRLKISRFHGARLMFTSNNCSELRKSYKQHDYLDKIIHDTRLMFSLFHETRLIFWTFHATRLTPLRPSCYYTNTVRRRRTPHTYPTTYCR